jgi:diaminopimelate decarboxylase
MKIAPSIKKEILKADAQMSGAYFFYDIDGLKRQASELVETSEATLWYACKANPLSSIIKALNESGFQFDCASHGEINQVLAQRVTSDKLLTTGPAKSKKYFKLALKQGIDTFVIESMNQLAWLNEVAGEFNLEPNVLLRVQLDWEGEKDILGGNELSAFGLPIAQWLEVDLADYKNIEVIGVHNFQWGNILEIERFREIWSQVAMNSKELAQSLGFKLKVLDIGGGLGIQYTDEQSPLKWKEVQSLIKEIKEEFDLGDVWMELGRYVSGPYGYYVTEVYDKKTVQVQELLILDSGINHLMRPTLINKSFPVEMMRESNKQMQSYRIHGPLCTALDQFGEVELPSDIQVGDKLVFSQCGAYGFTESMPYFLCHELPGEVILKNKRIEVVREIEQPTSWLR